ncbi:alpha/beta hydrolase [Streptosporangium sandarakinum]|uniref:alpha/beta hydrolase family protein n=1 Tax=Streptosporangium sandarakinum TaxID=1260955 RepID=UPI00379C4EFE
MPYEDLFPALGAGSRDGHVTRTGHRPSGTKPERSGSGPVSRGALAVVAALLALVVAAPCASTPASASTVPASVATATVAVPASAGPPAARSGTPDGTPSGTPAGAPIGAPYLPRPTGPHPVGTTSLHLRDLSRPDPWVPGVKARELMVSLWYPAKSPGGRRAPYMTPKESELVLKGTGMTGVPADALSRTRTNAFRDASPAGRRRGLPLVVLSPGFTWPRSSLTALAEELASRGYVVAGIDHTYETFATTFPDGRVTTCAACELETDDFGGKAVKSRAADTSFVLAELVGPRSKWRGGALIDPSRIAMAGQSLGGASVAETMLKDPRVRAGINMDGQMFAPIPVSGLARPFMFLGVRGPHSPGSGEDPTWDRDWRHLTGWKRWLVVTGAVHASFTDYDLLARQIGVDLGGTLSGPRTVEITRGYVRAFFDLHLREKPQALLRKPSPRHPEVMFCSPETKTCG